MNHQPHQWSPKFLFKKCKKTKNGRYLADSHALKKAFDSALRIASLIAADCKGRKAHDLIKSVYQSMGYRINANNSQTRSEQNVHVTSA